MDPCRAMPALLRLWKARHPSPTPTTALLTRLAAQAAVDAGRRWLASRL